MFFTGWFWHCNISQGGQGWCFSPDDSGINPIQRTICGWCSPNAAVIATESPAVNVAPATPCCRGFCRGRPVVPQRYLRGSALRKVCAMWAALSCLAGIIPQLCGGHTTHIYFHSLYVSTNLGYSVILYKYIWKACVSIYIYLYNYMCVYLSVHMCIQRSMLVIPGQIPCQGRRLRGLWPLLRRSGHWRRWCRYGDLRRPWDLDLPATYKADL